MYEGEVEHAFNRYVSDIARAYSELSDTRQREFKTEKYDYIATKYPDYSLAINRLLEYYR